MARFAGKRRHYRILNIDICRRESYDLSGPRRLGRYSVHAIRDDW